MMRAMSIAVVLITSVMQAGAAEPDSAVCDACHERGPNQAPSLDGQKPGYLRNQLQQFRSGARADALMSPVAKGLTDDDIERLVEHYRSRPALRLDPAKRTLDPSTRPLVFCVRCHGVDGISPNELWPNLAGLDVEYMRRQLAAYAAEQRVDDMMKSWGARLEGEALERVLEYFAAATPPGRHNSGD